MVLRSLAPGIDLLLPLLLLLPFPAAAAERTNGAPQAPAPVITLGPDTDALTGWDDGRVEELAASVRRGSGLVVIGDAAAALPGSERFSALLGRKHPPAAFEEIPGRGPRPLAVLDQEHPITQCLTHWILRRGRLTAEGDLRVTALVSAAGPLAAGDAGAAGGRERPLRPVLWVREEGAGRVAVLAIAAGSGAEKGESDLLAVLAARAVEQAGGRRITVPLPARLPLLAAAGALGGSGAPGGSGGPAGIPDLPGFFRGRQIAPVMGAAGAGWLERPDREETEEPEKVLDVLKLRPGSTVADLGAGVGYFSFRMARRVGPEGKVLAIDLQAEMVQGVRERAGREGIRNVEAILATEKDPRLPESGVDLVLMVDVYHELADPTPVMAAAAKALLPADGKSPSGRLVLVEYRGEDPAVPILPLHRTTRDQVRAELEGLGFRAAGTHEFLRHQRVLIFEPRGTSSR